MSASSAAFAYSADERAAITTFLNEHIGAQVDDDIFENVTEIARGYLDEFIMYPETGKAARRKHFRKVAKVASDLYELLDHPPVLEGASAAYLVNSGDDTRSGAVTAYNFRAALKKLASRAEDWSQTGYLPGTEPGAVSVPGWMVGGNNNVRTRMAHALLKLLEKVTGNPPTMTTNGPAVTWLLLTVNPAMRFAFNTLGVSTAGCMGENAAIDTIGRTRETD